jgi:hypothetical protein
MSNKVGMNVYLHFLLVIKQMNDFTVTEAKDALLHEKSELIDAVETRKFIYRQLTSNVTKGLLKRSERLSNGVKKVIYSKTDLFFTVKIEPITRGRKAKKSKTHNTQRNIVKAIDYQEELKKELLAYEIDLNTTLEEAKEYKRLSARFPKLQDQLQQHHSNAKDKSIKLLGKLHALQNLLGYTVTGHQSC